jgi:DNA-binding LytR/AlgR family response regulator
VLIDVDDVSYFQANDKYTSVLTSEGESLIRTPLRDLAAQLDPRHFWQVHRGTIVNVRDVAATTRDLAGHITLRMKSRAETVPVSRAYAHLFKQM